MDCEIQLKGFQRQFATNFIATPSVKTLNSLEVFDRADFYYTDGEPFLVKPLS